jgi:hypothetical protein
MLPAIVHVVEADAVEKETGRVDEVVADNTIGASPYVVLDATAAKSIVCDSFCTIRAFGNSNVFEFAPLQSF